MNPVLGPEQHRPLPKIPNTLNVQGGGQINVETSPKEHVEVESVSITSVDESIAKQGPRGAALLEKELNKFEARQKKARFGALGSIVGMIVHGGQQGLQIAERAVNTPIVKSILGTIGAFITLITAPISVAASWSNYFQIGQKAKSFGTSPSVDADNGTDPASADEYLSGLIEKLEKDDVLLDEGLASLAKIGVAIPQPTSKENLISSLKNDKDLRKYVGEAFSFQQNRLKNLEAMLKQRQYVEEKRVELLKPKFLQAASQAAVKLGTPLNKAQFQQVLLELRELGLQNLTEGLLGDEKTWNKVSDEEVTEAQGKLLSLLKDDESLKGLFKEHVDHHETLSVLARNGMQAMSAAKAALEKKVYAYTLAETTILSAFAIFTSLLTITGFALSLSGVGTIPGIVATVIGAIGIGLAVGSTALGNLYAYMTAPNRTVEEVFSLRGIRQTLSHFPYAYRKYFLERAEVKKIKNDLAIEVITAKLDRKLPESEDLRAQLKEHQDQIADIDRELKESAEKFKDAAKAYEKHRKVLGEAGIKDLAITHPQADLLFAAQKPHTPNLVDALDLMDDAGLDAMTEDALKHFTGIDLENLSEKAKNEILSNKSVLARELLAFYGGTLDEMLQNLKR